MSQAILPTAPAPRYHALDGMRAAMMLLGIYLHAVVAYAPIGGWPYKQAELTSTLNLTVALIHVFRMPAFYVMAGFFAALLYRRYGFRRAADNRIRRILVPFVVGWLILAPMVFCLAWLGRGSLDAMRAALPPGPPWSRYHPLHLWFLEYLLVLYGLAVITVPAVAALPDGLRARLNRVVRALVERPWGVLVLAIPSALALLPMRYASLDDPPNFVPALRIVVAYAIPFAFGWWLYANVDLLARLRRRAWPWTIAAVITSALYLVLLRTLPDHGWSFAAKCAACALAMWCLIFGIAGLFLRYLANHNPVWRWLCDSSYFLYLAHMPVMMAFQLAIEPVPIPPLAKIPLVLVATTGVLLVLYRYAVRPSVIGAVLNGRRYPVAMPA